MPRSAALPERLVSAGVRPPARRPQQAHISRSKQLPPGTRFSLALGVHIVEAVLVKEAPTEYQKHVFQFYS